MSKQITITDVIPLTITVFRDRDDMSRITMDCRYWLKDENGDPIEGLERSARAVLSGDIKAQVASFVQNSVLPHLRDREGLT